MRLLLTIALCATLLAAVAQPTDYTRADSTFVVDALKRAAEAGEEGQQPLFFAAMFLEKPYVGHTLEADGEEHLVVNTRQLDCTTLVENVAALTLCARRGQRSFDDFTAMLTLLRYRQGQLRGYESRLHYFTEWITDNSELGLVGEQQQPDPPFSAVQTVRVNYMTKHPRSYKALRNRPQLVDSIAAMERRVSGQRFKYIPKQAIGNSAALRKAIADGDIIAITGGKAGLDIAHLGFAVWRDDGLHLLNASMIHRRVVVEPMTLRAYLDRHPTFTGIRTIKIKY